MSVESKIELLDRMKGPEGRGGAVRSVSTDDAMRVGRTYVHVDFAGKQGA